MQDPGSADHHAFRPVPKTGVIYVTSEATKLGFKTTDPDWCNLGQGMPETGDLPGAPPRVHGVTIAPDDQEYAPVAGLWELREAVADLYNRLYRTGLGSQYTAENVCISGGGRAALTRAAASLGSINLGHFIPDYTAYEELLDIFKAFTSIPILLDGERGYSFTADDLRREVLGRGLSALLLSNPCNPTGNVVQGAELEHLVAGARERDLTLVLDEFYSHFVYTPDGKPGAGPVSAAAYVEDVERDPVLLVDGLTKSFRYPGWRVGWTLGPSAMIETMARTASSIDGGPSRVAQRAALAALEHAQADQETRALREVFARKRNLLVERLEAIGVRFARRPESTFYGWGTLEALPPPLDDAQTFFRRALERKVLTVPGEFFDVDPGKRRRGASPYRQWMRFSFGPPIENLTLGLDRLEQMTREAR